MKVLAVSGSLRAASINSALLRACAHLAPAGWQVPMYGELGQLPLFNPDLEATPPAVVAQLRAAVAGADALLIASPEYAHGVTGALKNALDWLVSFEGFVSTPVVVLNAAARAEVADASLKEILRTMNADLVDAASVCIPLAADSLTLEGMLRSPAVCEAIRASLRALGDRMDGMGKVLQAGSA